MRSETALILRVVLHNKFHDGIKDGGSIFLVVRQVRHEIFKFNYIHDYDIIIIGHERSSKVTGMLCCQ